MTLRHSFALAALLALGLSSPFALPVQAADHPQPDPTSQAASSTIPLPPGVQAGVMIQGVTQYRLANGLRIVLAPDDSRAQTTVNMTYLVGARREGPGE
ncbi:MAG TPA: insulinase family protein, partial [Castellaniella sp.]|nr:insulinase family protein [Castellaniella sp.]